MKLLTLTLLFVCIASGQNKNNTINDIPNVYVIIVDKDSLPSYSLYLLPEIRDSKLAKQWKMINELLFENDSLRQDNERLKLLYDKTLGMARKYRREIDSLRNIYKPMKNPNSTEERLRRLEEYVLKAIPRLPNHAMTNPILIDSAGFKVKKGINE